MSNIYRIIPFLWNNATTCQTAITIYGIDRPPPSANLKTQCVSLTKEDPASYWYGRTLSRLTIPDSGDVVTWSNLPLWLSYALSQGYTIVGDIGKLKPHTEFYISGP